MTSRQRVQTALRHQASDRIPFNLRPGPAIKERFRQEFGDSDFAEHFAHDIRYVSYALPDCRGDLPLQEWTPVPDVNSIEDVKASVRVLHERELCVCGGYICGVFEQAKAWLGDEAALIAPYENTAGFGELLDKITAWKQTLYGVYANAGVDIVWIGDDLGAQRSLIMSPAQYHRCYHPCHEQIVNHLRAIRPEVKIAFHCCGCVTPLIPDLIGLGIDILEAVQPEAMDIAQLKREFGQDITFWGGIGAQSVLQGTPQDVMRGVRETLRIMAPAGGYIAAPCHTLTEEVPWENVVAFHEAMDRYGNYLAS